MGVTFTPSSASFGPVAAGSPAVQLIEVNNNTGQPIELSLETGSEFSILSGSTTVAAHCTEELYVRYESAAEGSHSDALIATKTNASGNESARATLTGTTTAALEVSLEAIDFGDVLVGTSSVAVILITNNTGATIDLSPGGDFSVAPSSVESLGIPMQVVVTYEPTSAGADTATLAVDSLSCELSGNGVEEQDTAGLAAAAAAQEAADDAQEDADRAAAAASAAADVAGANAETLTYVEGEKTRFKIEVPTENTLFYLGRGTDSTDTQTYVDGCGLQTDANIFMRTKKGHIYARSKENIHLWSDGGSDGKASVTVHSDGSSSQTVISSSNQAYLIGEGGVVVNGGLDLDWKPKDHNTIGRDPDTGGIDTWATIFTAVDIALGASLALDAATSTAKDWKKSGKVKRFIEVAGTAGAIGAPIVGGFGAAGLLPGVTIFGQMAVSVFCPFYTAIYGVTGLGLVSAYPTMIAMVDATVWAGDDISLTAFKGDISIESGDTISINACDPKGGGTIEIMATAPAHGVGGSITLGAKEIQIGNQLVKPPPGGNPMTNKVLIEGSQLEADMLSKITLKVGAAELTMELDGSITLKGATNEIKLTPAGGIEMKSPTAIKLASSPAELQLGPSQAMVKYGSAQVMKMAAASTSLCYASNKLEIKASGLESSGAIHKYS